MKIDKTPSASGNPLWVRKEEFKRHSIVEVRAYKHEGDFDCIVSKMVWYERWQDFIYEISHFGKSFPSISSAYRWGSKQVDWRHGNLIEEYIKNLKRGEKYLKGTN